MIWIFTYYWIIGIIIASYLLSRLTEQGISGEALLYMITEWDDSETRDFYRNNPNAFKFLVGASMVVISLIWPYILYIIYTNDDYDFFRL